MKQAGYPKRPRGRSFDRRNQKSLNKDPVSENRGRTNFQQAVDKYLTLAREAASSGDPISAESYYQYADHYYRLASANRPQRTSEKRPPAVHEDSSSPPSLEGTIPDLIPQPYHQEAL